MGTIERPASIAIAGAWGYIGRKFLDAAIHLGMEAYVFDPLSVPADIDARRLHLVEDEQEFYQLPVEFFHLATHPECRELAIRSLVERSAGPPKLILNEKPMAAPSHPETCHALIQLTEDAGNVMLFDFPELYDELTERVFEFLNAHREVEIHELWLERSKDREDPDIPRNYKRMVPIQYQESVHCLAFALFLLGYLRGGADRVWDSGISVNACSELYAPPNPEDYRAPVDGRCEYECQLGDIRIAGVTDFKRGAPWSKKRRILGRADGKDFCLEVDFLEGRKSLTINGEAQPCDAAASSYEQVISRAWSWRKQYGTTKLMRDLFPNPRFAHLAYQLSSVLWRSAQDRSEIRLDSLRELIGFDAEFTSGEGS